MKPKVSIVGAGNVGGSTAHLLLQKNLASVVLIDIVEGLAKGKALDLGQSGLVEGYAPDITGSSDYKDIENSDIVYITAGLVRKPGQDRLDLLKKNGEIIDSIVKNIARYAPEAVIIMMTNPVDVLSYYAWKASGFSDKRVIGQAGVLDTARYKYFVYKETKEKIDAVVLGGHGDTMVPVLREPVTKLLSDEKINSIIDKTRNGGAEIVSLMKTSAFYAPAASAAAMIEAVLLDTKEIMPVSAYLNGEYGIEDVYIGVPAVLGRAGVEKIIEIDLTEKEKEALQKSSEIYKKSIKELCEK